MAWRAARHHLDERVPAKAMLEVAGRVAGLHAQVLSSAELTLSARVEDLEPDAVRRALWEERSLLKTWTMRGTLHLLPRTSSRCGRPPARVRRAAEAEAERLAAWSGGQLELGWADAASPGGAATG